MPANFREMRSRWYEYRPVIPWSENDEALRLGYINFQLAPGEKLKTCPYQNKHRILEARFGRHLTKCRGNYLKKMMELGRSPEITICRYSYYHHKPRSEMEDHERRCPNAASVVDFLQSYRSSMSFKDELKRRSKMGKEPKDSRTKCKVDPEVCDEGEDDEDNAQKLETSNNDVVMEEECWEAEVADNLNKGYVTYNAQIKLEQNKGKIIQSPRGIVTKSENKVFRRDAYEAFKARGGDFHDDPPEQSRNRSWSDGVAGPFREPERISEGAIRRKRTRKLATALKNASRIGGHLNFRNWKRQSNPINDK